WSALSWSSMKIAGAAQVCVFRDGGGFGGMPVGLVGGEECGDGLAGQPADLDGTRRHSLGALAGKIAIEAQDSEACPEALFGMWPAGENGGDQAFGLGTDRRAPAPETIRCPLGVAPMRTRHMIGVRAKARPPIAALMRGDALATVEYLDHPGGGTDIDLLADEAVRDGIEEALELDVIIRRDPRQAPFGELVVLCGKGCEGWAFDRLEEMPAADAEPAHDMIVDAREHLGDRGIGLGKREEGLLAQAAENAALGKAHGVLDLGLVLRASRPGRQDADTVVGRHHAVAAIDLGIMKAGAV